MKKRLLVLCIFALLFLSPIAIGAQNWCPPGATWTYGFTGGFETGYPEVDYTGDTIINSIQCKKLHRMMYWQFLPSSATYTTDAGTAYTYADADKVYIFRHNQFYTLYDFSAQPGDTWVVPGAKDYMSGCDSTGIVHVDSIGTMVINSQALRYVCVSRLDTSQHWGWNAKIVERIGSIGHGSLSAYDYLFPYKYDYCGMVTDELPEGGYFRCYSDNDPFSYSSGIAPSCDYITNVLYANDPHPVSVFPNPSQDAFTVSFGDLKMTGLVVRDLSEREILQEDVRNKTRVQIDVLPPGAYYCRLWVKTAV